MTDEHMPETGAHQPETGSPHQPETGSSSRPETGPAGTATDDAAYWRSQADKYERRAKSNADAAKELDRIRRDAMSDQERAAAEAADKARAEVTAQFGGRLILAEIRAAAEGRLSAEQVQALATHLDTAAFLAPDGDVNATAISEFVDQFAPAEVESLSGPVFPDLGQGARGRSPRVSAMDPLERDLRDKLGSR
jgi:hypothetical protein